MERRKRSLPRGWYPVDERGCRREIESYIEGWGPPGFAGEGLGGVVPHAGWTFSGRLAARVFQTLARSIQPELVVLFGGHLGGRDLPLVFGERICETPLGEIETDQDFIAGLAGRVELGRELPVSGDNTVEIQLTLIRYFFPQARLVAVRSPASRKAIALGQAVADLAKEKGRTLIAVGSTDLTHYGPNYGFAPRGFGPEAVRWVKEVNDRGWIDLALKMDAEGLLDHADEHGSACSAGAAASAVSACRILGAGRGELIGYSTSHDVMADESFVGYAGIVYV
jgi:MEMO1 family protein